MSARSQADVEALLVQCWQDMLAGRPPAPAMGDPATWQIELAGRAFLLHPGLARWLRRDELHGEWTDAGIGPGEAVLFTAGRRSGAKRVPGAAPGANELRSIGDWCVLQRAGQTEGPLPGCEVRQAIEAGRLGGDASVWGTGSRAWETMAGFLRLPPPPAAERVGVGPGGSAGAQTVQPPVGPRRAPRALTPVASGWWIVAGGRTIALPDRFVFGRAPDCDLPLTDSAVSRQHARIERRGDGFVLLDLSSRNGTYLNGRLVAGEAALADGDILRIGETQIAVKVSQATP